MVVKKMLSLGGPKKKKKKPSKQSWSWLKHFMGKWLKMSGLN